MSDQRKSARKIFKAKVQLALDGKPPVLGRTLDIGADGASITLPNPVGAGLGGQVRFDLLVEGRPNTVTARCKVIHCILSRGEFKVGLHFAGLDTAANSVVARFLR
jgi:PilZ domain